jgi:hypothetical protein
MQKRGETGAIIGRPWEQLRQCRTMSYDLGKRYKLPRDYGVSFEQVAYARVAIGRVIGQIPGERKKTMHETLFTSVTAPGM